MKINVQNDYNSIIERKIVELLSSQGFAVSKKDALYEVNVSCVFEITNEKTDLAESFTSYPSIEIIIQNKGFPLFSYSKACTKTVTFNKQKNLTLGYQKNKETLIKARRAFNQRFLLTFSSCHKLYVMATYRKLVNLKG